MRFDQLVSRIGTETSESFTINLFFAFPLQQNDVDFCRIPNFHIVPIAIVLSRVTVTLSELT